MKRTFLFAITFAVLAIASALVLNPARAKAGETAGTEIKVDNFTFAPDTLTIPVNSTVTWVNKDDLPHVIAANDGSFKSKALDTDQKFSFTFSKPGTYQYFCSIHPKMVGKVVVQ